MILIMFDEETFWALCRTKFLSAYILVERTGAKLGVEKVGAHATFLWKSLHGLPQVFCHVPELVPSSHIA